MSIKIDASSNKAIVKIKGLKKLTGFAKERAGYNSGQDLLKQANTDILKKPKTGRLYFRRDSLGRRRRHRASSQGETHANLSGTLRKTLGFKVSQNDLDFGFGVDRGDAPPYAQSIENTRNTLENTIRASKRNIENNLRREIKKIGK